MAWAHCALSSSFPPSTFTVTAKKTLNSASSLPPLKLTKRKNYLRPKLLKTLTKPYPSPILPQKNTVEEEQQLITQLTETLEIQEEEEIGTTSDRNVGDFSNGGGSVIAEEEEEVKNEEKELDLYSNQVYGNGGAGVSEAAAGIFSTRGAIELGLYAVGIFVLQTVCAVWIFGAGNLDKKAGNEEKEVDLGAEMVNGKKKGGFLFNLMGNFGGNVSGSKPGGFANVNDESVLNESIVRIRAMAREAREIEAKKVRNNGLGSSSDAIGIDEEEDVPKVAVPKVKNNIEKEVEGRLSKLEKRLRTVRKKSTTALSVSYLQSSSKVEDKKDSESSNGKAKDGKLVFRKKKKFRNYPKHPENPPKGFQGGKESYVSAGNGSNVQPLNSDLGELRGSDEEDSHLSDDTRKESMPKMQGNEDVDRELSGKEVSSFQAAGETSRSENGKPRSGFIKETSKKSVDLRKSSNSKTNISRSFTKEVEHGSRNNSPRNRGADIKNDYWWMNLPYVMAIFLHRGPDEAKALYSLKMDEGSSSYVVAFEDRRDATNFSYILESFFEDLGGVSADVVPLPMEEIKDSLKSNTLKIIVVRKGQLNLYAGQPLGDVEMALRATVD